MFIPDAEIAMTSPKQMRVAVVGVGTMGSQVLYQLARRGIQATGFEQFGIGHEHGAAGGETRIFRVAYKEGSVYVPLLREARRAWLRLGAEAGVPILDPCGALTIGSADDPDVRTVLGVLDEWDLDVERIDPPQAAARVPRHRLFDDDVVLLDREGGLLDPKRAVVETARLATVAGARVVAEAKVVGIDETGTGVAVRYRRDGETLVDDFDQVIVCTGPWIARIVPALAAEVQVRRAVLSWFSPRASHDWSPARFPVGIRRSGGDNTFSFFPDVGAGVKINLHVAKSVVNDPDRLEELVEPDYVHRMSTVVTRCLDGLSARPATVHTYMDGYTADNHGIIGRVPGKPSVLAMAGFSGHGFKLAPVFASAAADLIEHGDSALPIDHLALSRLTGV
jgi:sarcosine oxidase